MTAITAGATPGTVQVPTADGRKIDLPATVPVPLPDPEALSLQTRDVVAQEGRTTALERVATCAEAMAGLDARPFGAHEVFLRMAEAFAQNPLVGMDPDAVISKAARVAEEYAKRYPAPPAA